MRLSREPNLNVIMKSPGAADYVVNKKLVEPLLLEDIRGRSLNDSLIIADEAQNMTPGQVKTVLSRVAGSQLSWPSKPQVLSWYCFSSQVLQSAEVAAPACVLLQRCTVFLPRARVAVAPRVRGGRVL